MKNKILLVTITIFAAAVLSVLILHACRAEEQEEMTQTKEEPVIEKTEGVHETTIMVDGRGEFKYDNGLIRVYPGETVVWKCPTAKNNPFTIHIGWDSPFKECSYRSENGEDIRATLPKNARPGYYRYMVAVLIEGEIHTDDPELIVKRPGGK